MTRPVNWQELLDEVAPLRRRWDVPVLVSLADGRKRPADLIKVINSDNSTGRETTWKVLTDTLRRLQAEGYVARRQVPAVPRETWYWLRPAGHRLVCALTVLENWLSSHDSQDA
jgi:DNA-binding HxlR family transcriptional regulator